MASMEVDDTGKKEGKGSERSRDESPRDRRERSRDRDRRDRDRDRDRGRDRDRRDRDRDRDDYRYSRSRGRDRDRRDYRERERGDRDRRRDSERQERRDKESKEHEERRKRRRARGSLFDIGPNNERMQPLPPFSIMAPGVPGKSLLVPSIIAAMGGGKGEGSPAVVLGQGATNMQTVPGAVVTALLNRLNQMDPASVMHVAAANGSAGGAVGVATLGLSGAPLTMAPAASMGATRQNRHARRLYIGACEPCENEELTQFIEACMATATNGKHGQGICLNTYVNKERHFAFVEFATVPLCASALLLSGIGFKGSPLRIRRPNDFNPELMRPTELVPLPDFDRTRLGLPAEFEDIYSKPSSGSGGAGAAAVNHVVPDSPNKVFIGGLPYNLTDEQVKSLLTPFGPLKHFVLVRDPNSVTSKGYAFCEWEDSSVTDKAVEGLHGLPLGNEKTLTVRHAMSSQQAKDAMQAKGSVNGALAAASGGAVNGTVAADTIGGSVLVLGNMITADDFKDPEELADIKLDVKEECANYGKVKEVVLAPPGVLPGEIWNGLPLDLLVFVAYTTPEEAQAAGRALQGRQFAAKRVDTGFMQEGSELWGKLLALKQ